MSWVIDLVVDGITGFFAKLAGEIITNAFSLISDLILTSPDIDKYIKVSEYVKYIQIIAGGLLVVLVAYEVFKQLSGGMIQAEEKSISSICLQTVWAAFLIYFLPKSVTKIFIPINNHLIELMQGINIKVEASSLQKFLTIYNPAQGFASLGIFMVLMLVVLGVGFLIIGIAGGIRYIEILMCVVFAPFSALSAVGNGEGIQIWIRETIAAVFTQAVHVFLLQVLLKVIGVVQGPTMVLLCLGIIVVMLRGPKVLRNFLYSSGVGSGAVSAAGTGGRMAAMKFMMKSAVPMP